MWPMGTISLGVVPLLREVDAGSIWNELQRDAWGQMPTVKVFSPVMPCCQIKPWLRADQSRTNLQNEIWLHTAWNKGRVREMLAVVRDLYNRSEPFSGKNKHFHSGWTLKVQICPQQLHSSLFLGLFLFSQASWASLNTGTTFIIVFPITHTHTYTHNTHRNMAQVEKYQMVYNHPLINCM